METEDLVLRIIQLSPRIPKTKVVKLCYLFDLAYVELTGAQRSRTPYIRYLHGPYSFTIEKALQHLRRTKQIDVETVVTIKGPGSLHSATATSTQKLTRRDEEILSYIVGRFGDMDTAQIEDFVYRTAPMVARHAMPEDRKPLNMSAQRPGLSASERKEMAAMALQSWRDFEEGRTVSSREVLSKLGLNT